MEQEVHSIVKTEEGKEIVQHSQILHNRNYQITLFHRINTFFSVPFHSSSFGMCNSRECLFVSFTSAVSIIIVHMYTLLLLVAWPPGCVLLITNDFINKTFTHFFFYFAFYHFLSVLQKEIESGAMKNTHMRV